MAIDTASEASPRPRAREPFVTMVKATGPVCNLDCDYCYYLDKADLFPRGERFRMDEATLEAYVAGAIEASPGPVVHFVWHGGEPTLAGRGFFARALALQEQLLPKGWSCVNSLQTNGTLLDEDWCDFLADHHFAVGLSIDGPARLHDAGRVDKRGRPTHARALRALRLLRERGVDPDVLCTLNAHNATEPEALYRFFLAEGVRWLQFLPVVRRSPDAAPGPGSVTAEQLGAFLCAVFDEWVRHDVDRIGIQVFLEAAAIRSGQRASLCTMAETCGRALAIEHDGGVYACDHFVEPAHRLGTLGRDSLAELVEAPGQVAFGDAKRDGLTGTCRACPVLELCRGGCPKDRFGTSPAGEAGHNVLCDGYRTFFAHALPLLDQMVALARRGRPIAAVMDELRREEHRGEAAWHEVGRNAPCPCGSGRKYKACCLGTHRVR